GESDAEHFFGRDALVAQLVGAVAEHRLVAVVGPSGIGKSSVVKAGLVPTLRNGALPGSERWLVADLFPGAYPFEDLAAAPRRADFLDHPLRYPKFGELLGAGLVTVPAPSEDELAEAIERPAAAVGVRFEPGLVSQIVGDVHNQPGALPLLQYALTELFAART